MLAGSFTVPGILLPADVTASRPAATDVAPGTLFPSTDDDVIYQSDGATWSTWATLAGAFAGDATDVPIIDAGAYFTGTDVEAALQELGAAGPGGGGGLMLPTALQFDTTTNGNVLNLPGTPAAGSRLILAATGSNSGTTAVSSANTTWTRMGTGFTNGAGQHLDIWVGICAASPGTAITITNTATFVQCAVAEVADALTPTSATLQGSTVTNSPTPPFNGSTATTPLVPAGAGNFLAIWASNDNAGNQPSEILNIPVTLVSHQTGCDFYLAYTPSGGSVIALTDFSDNGGILMVEIT